MPHSDRAAPPDLGGERIVPRNFVTDVVDADLRTSRVTNVTTRFPPEPNGYLHIGHAKAITLDFGLARDYGGRVNLRMDDTNPTTEDPEFVEAIQEDVRWLGFEWDELRYASDYFDHLYALARRLIGDERAYVDSQSEAEIRATRGTITEAGRPSPHRDRGVDENLDLFERMRTGEFPDGAHVLRARIDMASPNMVMRDPVLYRIKHAHHYRTGDAWPIYPLYDFAHPLSDAIEGVTHSLCSLEFENNRAIYDWLVEALFPRPRPRQYEFARLFLDYTVLSKRKLIALVHGGHVAGWDDPRMPTIAGLRRGGIPAEAVRDFALRIGVTRTNSRTDPALLDASVRDALNPVAPRVMAVLDPLEVELRGLEEVGVVLDAPSFPDDVDASGSRRVALGTRILIERDDFELDPPPGFKRLAPGRSVRLRHAFVVTCEEVVQDEAGRVERVVARVHRDSLGTAPDGLRVWAAIHWVDAATALPAEFRLYGRLFAVADVDDAEGEFTDHLAPDSLRVVHGVVEGSVADDPADTRYQFERLGYFWRDPIDGRGEALVFDRIVPLKDARARSAAKRERATRDAAAHGTILGVTTHAGEAPGSDPDPIERLDRDTRPVAEALTRDHGLARGDAALIAATPTLLELLHGALRAGATASAAGTWIANDVQRALKELGSVPPTVTGAAIAEIAALVAEGSLTTALAREVLQGVMAGGGTPSEIVAERGLRVEGDERVLARHAAEAVAAHPSERDAYRSGKVGLLGFFVGQVMRATGGRADPATVRRVVEGALEEGTAS
ncbi:glutamine--tRNA ligase/YqeY domain fusion protein [soil metagenome]